MQTISLLQYVKDNSSDQSVQLPSFINYLKSVNLIEITKPNKLPRITSDTSYQDFINNLITELVLRKSQNVLVSGYKSTIEDSKVALPCVNLDGNFLPTNLNDSNWHRVFTLLGSEKFLNLLINHKGFLKHKNGQQIQIFGDITSYAKPAAKAVLPIPKWIYKFDVLYQSRNPRYRNYEIIRTNVQEVLAEIVSPSTKNPNSENPAVKKRFRGIKNVVSRIILNDKKCRYDLIYNKYLLLSDTRKLKTMIDYSTKFNRVVEVVLIIMGKLLPLDAWGGTENKKVIQDRIVDFLRLGANERLHLDDVLSGIKLLKFKWLGVGNNISSQQDFQIRKRLLEGYINWVFISLVKNIVRAFWYVTELSNMDRLKLFYFTHSIWNELSLNWITKYAKGNLVQVESPESKGQFTNGKIKLIPKRGGFRVICVPLKQSLYSFNNKRNFALKQKEKWDYIFYQKYTLLPVRQVLQLKLNALRKSDMGHRSSVNSTNEVADRILTFRNDLLKKNKTLPVLYMIKFDMKECYDRLNQNALKESIAGIFKEDNENTTYHVREYGTLDEFLKLKRVRTLIETEVQNFNIIMNSKDEDEAGSRSYGTKVDKVKTLSISKNKIIEVCHSQIEDATCLVKNKEGQYDLFKRKRGVFQGFSLLGIFCDILYSTMVLKEFKFLWEATEDNLLLRLVDDFIFITSNKDTLKKVKDKISSNELQKYGAFVNHEKTVEINGEAGSSNKMTFVGLDINCLTLDVKKDSSQFSRPTCKFRSFKALFSNLKQFYCSNLSEFLLDFSSNSLETIRENVDAILKLTFEAIQTSFATISKQDSFERYRFMKFLHVIIETTIEKFARVNGSMEGVEYLLTCIKITITKSLAFMATKQEIIEWLYTLTI